MATNVPTVARKQYTYADYAKLPEGAPYQLIGGELVMSPSPTPFHQIILLELAMQLKAFVETNHWGIVLVAPIDVYLSELETYQPDILLVSQERRSIIGEQKIEGPPDLVMEILSPSTAYYDLKHKMKAYEVSGVKEYWIVDPVEKTVEVHANATGQFRLIGQAQKEGQVRSNLLPGFEVSLATLFG